MVVYYAHRLSETLVGGCILVLSEPPFISPDRGLSGL